MKSLLTILLFASCTTTKTWLLDGSESKGDIVEYRWTVNSIDYLGKTMVYKSKSSFKVELIVTDKNGLKDSTFKIIGQ